MVEQGSRDSQNTENIFLVDKHLLFNRTASSGLKGKCSSM